MSECRPTFAHSARSLRLSAYSVDHSLLAHRCRCAQRSDGSCDRTAELAVFHDTPGLRRSGRPSGVGTRSLPAPIAGLAVTVSPAVRRPSSCAAPHQTAASTPVPADSDQQQCQSPPERLVRQRSDHRIAGRALTCAASACPSGCTTRHASTARLGSKRCPVTCRPSSSSRQNVVTSRRRRWRQPCRGLPDGRVRNSHHPEASTPTPATTRSPRQPALHPQLRRAGFSPASGDLRFS